MIRTQIRLTEEQVERLKELARTGNKSMAGIIREALDQFLENRGPGDCTLRRQAFGVAGKYRCGLNDISIAHDKYLEDAFGK